MITLWPAESNASATWEPMKPAPPLTQTIRERMQISPARHELNRLEPLSHRFYQRETVAVAQALLGKILVRRLPDGLVAVRLTDVEAYLGVGDRAAHTFGGRRTARNATMWGDAGRLYVYFTYGMHFCCNVVTRAPEVPEAVLLRGAVPLLGRDALVARRGGLSGRHLLDGPAKLCQAMGIDRALDGADLTRRDTVWLLDDGLALVKDWIVSGRRIGVGYAGEAADWPLRFRVILDHPVNG
jgi:DNA-3-methyladenine glycosylase